MAIYLLIVLLLCMVFVFESKEGHFAQQNFREGYEQITTANPTNKNVKFYYYLPEDVLINPAENHNVMILVPGLNGDERGFINSTFKDYAQKNKMIILIPKFVQNNADMHQYKSYQYPSAWSGKALMDVLKKFDASGIKTGKLYMFGFSAGAQYVLRFALWQPALVTACMGHAPGCLTKPQKQIGVKLFITVGEKDIKDRILVHHEFLDAAKAFNIPIKAKIYKGLGHGFNNDQVLDCLNFFSEC